MSVALVEAPPVVLSKTTMSEKDPERGLFLFTFSPDLPQRLAVTGGVLCYHSVMKVLVLYRPNSEYARRVEDFVKNLQLNHNFTERQVEVLDYDSREGAAMASLYDIMTQPGIVITDDNGSYMKGWAGGELPLADEIVGYTFNRG
jgi:hypothetical protein